MDDLELLKRAKQYIDCLAGGIDPLTGEEMPEGELLNHVRLTRCFFYVSDVLRRVVENNGQIAAPAAAERKPRAPKKPALAPFALSELDKLKIRVSAEPVFITYFTEQINTLIDTAVMKKLKYTTITAWLLDKGLLTEEITGDRKRRVPSRAGQNVGIYTEERVGAHGAYTATLYADSAQAFIIDHLDDIAAFAEGPTGDETPPE